ncbi:hypothetical protein [Desulfopila sp. IMCC35006]|nr:hypothetical protein [Desulfopila sp. IMCC35006]
MKYWSLLHYARDAVVNAVLISSAAAAEQAGEKKIQETAAWIY